MFGNIIKDIIFVMYLKNKIMKNKNLILSVCIAVFLLAVYFVSSSNSVIGKVGVAIGVVAVLGASIVINELVNGDGGYINS